VKTSRATISSVFPPGLVLPGVFVIFVVADVVFVLVLVIVGSGLSFELWKIYVRIRYATTKTVLALIIIAILRLF